MNSKAPRFERKSREVRRQQLIEAAIRCLADGGISGFTIDRVCHQAEVSRGLINHHFAGKEELLICAYETMTDYLMTASASSLDSNECSAEERLTHIIDSSFDTQTFNSSQLRAWLTVWGEVAANDRLKEVHRHRYGSLRNTLAGAIQSIARRRNLAVEQDQLARLLIATLDGLWLEHCLDPEALSLTEAKEDCYRLLEMNLGPIR